MKAQVLASESTDSGPAAESTACGPDSPASTLALARTELAAHIYACYGKQAAHILAPDGVTDRLSALERLGTEAKAGARRALFLALQPMWRSVNGDNQPGSPYRTLVAQSAAHWRESGSPIDHAVQSLGLEPARAEAILVSVLEAWRERTSPALTEPWDWFYANHEINRVLSPGLRVAAMRTINARYYRALGADPATLGIRFDLAPRKGKSPVAFTQFGRPPHASAAGVVPGQAWVFATYRNGGFDNLVELLHETGHAVHISAIATRPAFADWPDSDPFTESIADFTALEAYEPAWQQKYLGKSVPAEVALRGKLAGIVLDIAWALFEVRMHQAPQSDPNQVWSAITQDYLRIAPHPEWSWWAMRGQLVDAPGYMVNYALGAMLTAALCEHAQVMHGPFHAAGAETYAWLKRDLLRFGRSKAALDVTVDFLGKPLDAAALIVEIKRLPAAGPAVAR
jgi:hypothetical protein